MKKTTRTRPPCTTSSRGRARFTSSRGGSSPESKEAARRPEESPEGRRPLKENTWADDCPPVLSFPPHEQIPNPTRSCRSLLDRGDPVQQVDCRRGRSGRLLY